MESSNCYDENLFDETELLLLETRAHYRGELLESKTWSHKRYTREINVDQFLIYCK